MMPSLIRAAARLCLLSFCGSVLLLPLAGRADDNTTISKSRLQELERKEAELEKLKGDLKKTTDENKQLKKERDAAPPKPAEPAPVKHVSPPIASLPALKPGDVIDAMDLANYYKADPAAADARFRKQKIKVRGEIVGFDRPMFQRVYQVILQTPSRDMRVVCDLYTPDKFSAVFPANDGSELVGVINGTNTRVPLAKVGQVVLIETECKGAKNATVKLSGGQLTPAPAQK